jgi:hypothetical protein
MQNAIMLRDIMQKTTKVDVEHLGFMQILGEMTQPYQLVRFKHWHLLRL